MPLHFCFAFYVYAPQPTSIRPVKLTLLISGGKINIAKINGEIFYNKFISSFCDVRISIHIANFFRMGSYTKTILDTQKSTKRKLVLYTVISKYRKEIGISTVSSVTKYFLKLNKGITISVPYGTYNEYCVEQEYNFLLLKTVIEESSIQLVEKRK